METTTAQWVYNASSLTVGLIALLFGRDLKHPVSRVALTFLGTIMVTWPFVAWISYINVSQFGELEAFGNDDKGTVDSNDGNKESKDPGNEFDQHIPDFVRKGRKQKSNIEKLNDEIIHDDAQRKVEAQARADAKKPVQYVGWSTPPERAVDKRRCDGVASAEPVARQMQILSLPPPEDSPAAMAFDGMLLRALAGTETRHEMPPLDVRQSDTCKETASDDQLVRFLEECLGKTANMPGLGVMVPVEVTCLVRHSCRTLNARRERAALPEHREDKVPVPDKVSVPDKGHVIDKPESDRFPTTLLHVEFLATRAGDTTGHHYEAQLTVAPLALVWFRRRGSVSSYDAKACPGIPKGP